MRLGKEITQAGVAAGPRIAQGMKRASRPGVSAQDRGLGAGPLFGAVWLAFALLGAGVLPGWVAGGTVARAAERVRALTPEESMATFQVEPGLRVELVAAEPLVVDPVAFAFDEHHRLYVVEGRGYPEEDDAPYTHEGRVARLEDTDGDGRYDRRTEFATGLTHPNGITVWRGGVFVTCAPDIFYLRDTTGDGVADERRVVLTGFSTAKSTHSRVSAPILGWDGKIYVACGGNGGLVVSPEHPDRPPVEVAETDGRFDPDTLVYEKTSGRSQFGLAFDAFDRRFGSVNRTPVRHMVLEPWELQRNPHLAFNTMVQDVSMGRGEAKVFPISAPHMTSEWNRVYRPERPTVSHVGTFTAGSGLVIFGGSGMAEEHVGNAFICEPAQNLVQRQILHPAGATFRSETPHEGREFLASTDVAFRPVFVGNGPDGALYVADMYRREIEHPHAAPEDLLPLLDFEGGKGEGRIYRIVRTRAKGPALAGMSLAELGRELESAESWRRRTAHRLLLERSDASAIPLLEACAKDGRLATSRANALWLLQDLGALRAPTVARALADPAAGVREHAVRLADELPADGPELLEPLLAAARDPDARVRFVTALALGTRDDPRAVDALAALAVRDGEDLWARAAVLSGVGSRLERFFAAVSPLRNTNPRAHTLIMADLAQVFGAGAPPESGRQFVAGVLADDPSLGWCLPAVLGVVEGTRGRADFDGRSSGTGAAAKEDFMRGLVAMVGFSRLAKVVGDERAPTEQRISAVALLGHGGYPDAVAVLGSLLDARHDPELQMQAVRTLERLGSRRGAEFLVQPQNWAKFTPRIRGAVLAALTSRSPMIEVLLEAVQQGTIPAASIPPFRRTRLLEHSDPAIKRAAEAGFRQLESGDRMQVYQAYRDVLNLPGNVARGAEVFGRACAVCHAYDGSGGTVGPELTGVRSQAAETILFHILVPNHEIAPGYEAVAVTTRDNVTHSGRIVAETDNGITLHTVIDTEENVMRSNIASLVAVGVSLMPDGLEHAMSREEMADLIAYLKQQDGSEAAAAPGYVIPYGKKKG